MMRRRVAWAITALPIAMVGGVIAVPADAAPARDYIVVLEDSSAPVALTATRLAHGVGAAVDDVFEYALDAFTVHLDDASARRIAADPRVAFVEPDRPVTIDASTEPTGVRRVGATANPMLRIDGNDDVRVDADVAVIDTGIDLQHPDLVVAGSVNCIVPGAISGCSAGGDDDHFHGTHVAGIIGALDNGDGVTGVAPGVRLWSVKVLDSTGNGLVSSVLRGIDFVTARASTIEVANLSLGVPGFDAAMFAAIQSSVNVGVAFTVAAGNADADAGGFSPASFANVLTVSALADFDGLPGGLASSTCILDTDDTLADFSNWGTVVDVVAPGACIRSTLPLEKGGSGLVSGTSMASPHVAGALALLARSANPASAADVAALYSAVVSSGSAGWTDDSGDGQQEPLLDVHRVARFQAAPLPSCPLDPTDVIGWWTAESTTIGTIGNPLSGPASFATGSTGSAFALDGRSSLSDADLAAPTVGLTVDGWFRLDPNGAGGTLVSRWDHLGPDGGADSRAFLLSLEPVGSTVSFSTDEQTTRVAEVLRVPAPVLYDHSFHHIAATWDQRSISIYVDGDLLASRVSPGGVLNPASSVPLRIGASSGRGDPIFFRGVADDVSVWRRALSPLEVATRSIAGQQSMCV